MRKTRNRRKQKGGWVVWSRRVKKCESEKEALSNELTRIKTTNHENKLSGILEDILTLNKVYRKSILRIYTFRNMFDDLISIFHLNEKHLCDLAEPPWKTELNTILSEKKYIEGKLNKLLVDILKPIKFYNENKEIFPHTVTEKKIWISYFLNNEVQQSSWIDFNYKKSRDQNVESTLESSLNQYGGVISFRSKLLECYIEKENIKDELDFLEFSSKQSGLSPSININDGSSIKFGE